MPTYQYQCKACNDAFEIYQSIKDEALTHCPKCNTKTLSKLITGGSGYFLKDSGVLPDAKPKPKDFTQKKSTSGHTHRQHHCHHHH